MRADRLLALLMLLQSRGQLTAGELSRELEVCERTIYRDIDALSAAGVPVYAERGPAGGYALLDSYRTDLTGLTQGELRALFLLSIPDALDDLGLGDDLAAALRKLSAALPQARRTEEAQVRQRFYLDASPGGAAHPANPNLQTLQQAAWDDERVDVTYRLASGTAIKRRIDVYGLVAKDGAWWALHGAHGRTHALPVADLVEVRLSGERFERPASLDLQSAWSAWCAEAAARPLYQFTVAVEPHLAGQLGHHGIQISAPAEALHDGRVMVRAVSASFEAARAGLLSLGGAVEALAPEPLRRSVMDYAEQISLRYTAS
jgi:predicted DNA-binding transcriptional regulator YafY